MTPSLTHSARKFGFISRRWTIHFILKLNRTIYFGQFRQVSHTPQNLKSPPPSRLRPASARTSTSLHMCQDVFGYCHPPSFLNFILFSRLAWVTQFSCLNHTCPVGTGDGVEHCGGGEKGVFSFHRFIMADTQCGRGRPFFSNRLQCYPNLSIWRGELRITRQGR